MPTPKTLIRTAAVLTVLNLLAAVVWAGPMLFEKKKLPDDVRSLALIEELRLEIEPFPGEMVDIGVKHEPLRKLWSDRLVEAGYEITEEKDTPQIRVQMTFTRDDRVKNGLGFSVVFMLAQPITVEGIEGKLMVPTYVSSALGIETKETIREATEGVLRNLLESFISHQQVAAENR